MSIFKIDCLNEQSNDLKHNFCENYFKNNSHRKCIIIGSNISIISGNYGNYIDSCGAYIVRINREPQEQYFLNYGRKTDLYITHGGPRTVDFINKHIQNTHVLKNCFVIIRSPFRLEPHPRTSWATSGFFGLCLLANFFDEIELFGFGFTKRQFSDKGFHYFDNSQLIPSVHNVRLEDNYINKFQLKYPGKIYRGEEKHVELHCSNTCKI